MIFMNRAIELTNFPFWCLIVISLGFILIYYQSSMLVSYLINLNLKRIRDEIVYDVLSSYLNLSSKKFIKKELASSIFSLIVSEIENLISNYYS